MHISKSELLHPADPPLFDFYEGSKNLLLICEHGGNAVPTSMNLLGLDPQDMKTHAALDIGARALTENIIVRMNASSICANYSRLIIDLNRFPDAADIILLTCGPRPVPGNINLTANARDLRRQEFYDPFHNHIQGWLDKRIANGNTPVVIALHSYTSRLDQTIRNEEICIVSNTDRRLADPVISGFKAAGYKVGDNTPFDGRKRISATFNRHGDDRGIPCLMIEFRNDLLQNKKQLRTLTRQTTSILNAALSGLAFG